MSPELFKYKPYSYKSDIWSLGCIMYEVCNLKHAFDAQNLNGLAIKIIKGNYAPINPMYSRQLRTLIAQMLNIKHKERPSIEEILDKPFIKKKVIAYVIYLHRTDPDNDLYLDTVRQQCRTLKIWDLVEKYMNKRMDKQMSISSSAFLDSSDQQQLKMAKKQQEMDLKKAMHEGDHLDEQLKMFEQLRNSKEYGQLSQKEKVMAMKNYKKLAEENEKIHQLEDIRRGNQDNSLKAKRAKDMLYRDSNQVKTALKSADNDDHFDDHFDEGDFEEEVIKEEDEGEDEDIDERISRLQKKKEENTQNIESLRKGLKETTQRLNSGQNESGDKADGDEESAVTISDIGESENEVSEDREETLHSKFCAKINELETRCLNGIGETKYQKCLSLLREKRSLSADEIRPKVAAIIGDDLIGYWHLLDQILFYEDFLEEAKQI